ncbi:MAG: uroporphyrinogen decarboxylase family protein [Lachnospiraceae bacterium]|nr:uroporphyrinogen decarboxylase family protein [Lachnospiraceae bacterium]
MYLQQEEILQADLPELMSMCEETMQSQENQLHLNNQNQFVYRVGIGRTVFAKAFGFHTMDYYSNMELCLREQLRWKLWNFHVLQDDTPFDMDVGIDYATAYEPSLYGVDVMMEEGMEPTYGRPIIKEPEDLDKLSIPDFYTSGLMPKVHEQYRKLKDLSQGRFRVFFPGFSRGPWSIATILRGFNELFLDMMDDPDFVHKLMQYALDSRISWEKQRCEFLGIDPKDRDYRWKYIIYRDNYNSDSFEDEVNGNMFSASMFREFILPYEKQMADFYGGIGYYHSCGNLTSFLDGLAELNIFGLQHVSAWTDYEKAIEKTAKGVVVQVSLDAAKDVMSGDETRMRERIRYYLDHAEGRRVDICPDAIYEGGWETLDKVLKLTRIYREEAGK